MIMFLMCTTQVRWLVPPVLDSALLLPILANETAIPAMIPTQNKSDTTIVAIKILFFSGKCLIRSTKPHLLREIKMRTIYVLKHSWKYCANSAL